MDVLSEAKQKGIIRAHGCSCHRLRHCAMRPNRRGWKWTWRASIPLALHDADPDTVVSVLREMRAAGKALSA